MLDKRLERMSNDPVHVDPDGQWYFWDETWADRHGPFKTEEEASQGLHAYARWLDIPKEDLTCAECPERSECPFVDDAYNTDGDCLKYK